MHRKNVLPFVILTVLCAGCGDEIKGTTATPVFSTATLPPVPIQQATQPPTLPAPASSLPEETNAPIIDGTTTSQLNVRAGPSTAAASLGMIGMFEKVQIIGRDANQGWYQIVFAEANTGKGWVRAEYVQVNTPGEIPLVEVEPVPGTAVSGLVTQKVNVRNGPGTTYELLGVLNPNDVVLVTGRGPDGKWVQIEFAGAPDGKGWVTTEFLQAGNLEGAPVIGGGENVVSETATMPAPEPVTARAHVDGDSMQNPLVTASFSPSASRALQFNGDVSAPDGDPEDWILFRIPHGGIIEVKVACSAATLRGELWNQERSLGEFTCDRTFRENIEPEKDYFLRLTQNDTGYTNYALNLEVIR